MFAAFHVDGYFSLSGEVLLYFIERVEVIEIQIWFEFKLVQNLEMIWKIKSLFHIFQRPWAETSSLAQPIAFYWPARSRPTRPSWPEVVARWPNSFSPHAVQVARQQPTQNSVVIFVDTWPS
jgi:hypothetical protein